MASAPPVADSREDCPRCPGQLRRGVSGPAFVCGECGLIVEVDSADFELEEPSRPKAASAQLRIVGPHSGRYQPDLYRSGSGSTAASQQDQIFNELLDYRQRYAAKPDGRAFPIDVCHLAAIYYGDVQRHHVKRSLNKQMILAECIKSAGIVLGFAPRKPEIAAFMQLPKKGMARGTNFMLSLAADGKTEVDVNADPCRPEIKTLFAYLGMEGEAFAPLATAVYEIVKVAIRDHICKSSVLHSKISGAAYIAIRRCKDRSLVPCLELQDFCRDRIRRNTIKRVVDDIDEYHSHFAECFKANGLDDSPPLLSRGRPAEP